MACGRSRGPPSAPSGHVGQRRPMLRMILIIGPGCSAWPRGAGGGPGLAPHAMRSIQVRPRRAQAAPKLRPRCAQDPPKVRPRCAQGAPQMHPRCAQGAPNVHSRSAQGARKVRPKVRPRCAQGAQGARKARARCAHSARKMRPRRAQGAPMVRPRCAQCARPTRQVFLDMYAYLSRDTSLVGLAASRGASPWMHTCPDPGLVGQRPEGCVCLL